MADRTLPVIACEARGFPFDLHVDAELHDLLGQLFAALERRAGDPRAVFSIGRADGERTRWDVGVDGKIVMARHQRGEALHGLLVAINERMMAGRPDLLSIHAAGVATREGAVMLPGGSGSGKTTLCARLLQRGAAYLSDDSLALDGHGRLLGYPKPLSFKLGTWQQFGAGLADLDLDPETQRVWQVPPSRLGASSVAWADPVAVVVPRFEQDAGLRVEPLPRHAGAAALLEQAQNLLAFGVAGALEVIGRLAAGVSFHLVVYGDAREAAPAVLDLIGSGAGGIAPYEVTPASQPSGRVTQPYLAPDLSVLSFEDGALLVRDASGQFAVVDRIGALILPLIDGHRTIESIGAELAPLFGVAPSQIESDVSCWISELIDDGFLIAPERPPAP